ncbi:cell envelope integrity protein TolA [Umezawaea endophytica]|uniref:cell envelope integrity protein TolA n=1 Tax=Umezawaea endophytica TaxID=1654476 RepID=UPI0027E2FFFE|nr:cell envelope integrity protein TolA [Umezawaea endophytica]
MTENDRSGTSGTPETGQNAPTPQSGGPSSGAPAGGSTPPPYVPAAEQPPQQPSNPRGRIRQQDGSTKPRPPSLAEQRAREQAQRDLVAADQAREAEYARKKKVRKRLLIGGGVTVGVVALVAIGYAALSPDDVTATCTTSDDVVVADDNNCDENYARSHGGYSSGGFIYMPIVGGGYSQYRYNYGGTGVVGQKISGGTTVKPPKASISTRSGTSIQRGGFGVSSGGSKSGGS